MTVKRNAPASAYCGSAKRLGVDASQARSAAISAIGRIGGALSTMPGYSCGRTMTSATYRSVRKNSIED
jgi:hypothetical protein